MLGIGPVGVVEDHVGHVGTHRVLAPGAPGAQHGQRHPGHHGGQPGAQVLDVRRVAPIEADPGLLHGVVRPRRAAAEDSVGHGAQVGPVLLRNRAPRNAGCCGQSRPSVIVLPRPASYAETRRTQEM